MTTAYSQSDGDVYLAQHPVVASQLHEAERAQQVPFRHRPRLRRAGAFLYESGYMDELPNLLCGVHRDDMVETKAQEALEVLQSDSAGIVGSGMLWWYAIQWVILPYLRYLIRRRLFQTTDG